MQDHSIAGVHIAVRVLTDGQEKHGCRKQSSSASPVVRRGNLSLGGSSGCCASAAGLFSGPCSCAGL